MEGTGHTLTKNPQSKDRYIILCPDGSAFTIDDLPPLKIRWVASSKAEVVMAINGGLITSEDACKRYELSEEELLSWMKAYRC